MIKYLYSVLQEFPYNLGVAAATPADDHIFKISGYSETQAGAITDFSPHSIRTSFHEYQGTSIHTDGGDIYHHMCEETRQRRLGKTQARVEIYQDN